MQDNLIAGNHENVISIAVQLKTVSISLQRFCGVIVYFNHGALCQFRLIENIGEEWGFD